MSTNLTFSTIVSGLISASGSKSGSDNAAEIASPASVLAAQPGVLTTRVGNTAGTLTMTNAGHGIVTGQRFNLYWEGGACFGVIAGTVVGTSIPFTIVQGGNALPAAATAIIAGICQSISFELSGDTISALVCGRATASVRCYFVFLELNGVLALAVLNQAGQIFVWDGTSTGPIGSAGQSGFGTNPLAGTNPVEVWISHADTAAADAGLSAVVLKH